MLFSIITVTYNSERFLAEAMRSVLSQDGVALEYLIVDGGSKDGTVALINEFANHDSRIRWISEPDNGIADAFNKGIRMSRGEMIGILNSDDAYAPGALAAVAVAADEDLTCDVIHGDIIRFSDDTLLYRLKAAPVDGRVWHDMPLNHPATFVRKSAYERWGMFDPQLKVAMDYELVLRFYRAGCRFRHLGRVLAHMRYGGVSDDRFMAARREVYEVTIAAGYPRWRAGGWLLIKASMNITKTLLRKLGLFGLMRLHPKFAKHS